MTSALTKQSKKKSTKRRSPGETKLNASAPKRATRKASTATTKKGSAPAKRPAKRTAKKADNDAVQGDALFDQVIKMTGIPANAIRHELKTILERKNIDVKNLTVEQLRLVAASYVREIMGGMLDRTSPRKNEPHH